MFDSLTYSVIPLALFARITIKFLLIVNIVHSFNPDKKKYADAQKFCETAALNGFTKGRLFESKTQSFNDKVLAESKVVFGKKNNAWIGNNPKGGSLVWKSQKWVPHHPVDGALDCVFLHYINGRLPIANYHHCQFQQYFICEFV